MDRGKIQRDSFGTRCGQAQQLNVAFKKFADSIELAEYSGLEVKNAFIIHSRYEMGTDHACIVIQYSHEVLCYPLAGISDFLRASDTKNFVVQNDRPLAKVRMVRDHAQKVFFVEQDEVRSNIV